MVGFKVDYMDAKDLQAIGNLLDKKLDEKLQPIKKDLGEIKETVDSHSVSLMNLEKEIKIYNDALDVERKRIDGHDTQLTKVEETLAI